MLPTFFSCNWAVLLASKLFSIFLGLNKENILEKKKCAGKIQVDGACLHKIQVDVQPGSIKYVQFCQGLTDIFPQHSEDFESPFPLLKNDFESPFSLIPYFLGTYTKTHPTHYPHFQTLLRAPHRPSHTHLQINHFSLCAALVGTGYLESRSAHRFFQLIPPLSIMERRLIK